MLKSLKKELYRWHKPERQEQTSSLIDIINFSKLDSKQQLEIISFLTHSYRKVIETFIMGFIPTGDGFYCILNPKYKGYGF